MRKVSVIIPCRNDSAGLRSLLSKLKDQSLPQSDYEVIIIDDGSDPPLSIPTTDNHFLIRSDKNMGSYHARDLGCRRASGAALAFTDADCSPCSDWLDQGLKALQHYPIAAGPVVFTYSPQPSLGEYYDSLVNLQQEYAVKHRQVAFTCNFFCLKTVYADVGGFDITMRSSGDVEFCLRAKHKEYKIGFADKARIYHPARSLQGILTKARRIGRGKGQLNLKRSLNQQGQYLHLKILNPFFYTKQLTRIQPLPHSINRIAIYLLNIWVLANMFFGFMESRLSRRRRRRTAP